MAELLLAAGRKEEAVASYCAAAKAYDAAGKTKIVTAIYRHVLSLDPSRIEVYHLLVDAFLKDYLVGDAVETMIALATYYYDHDRHYEAAQTIKNIAAIDPNNTFYQSKVERFFKERNLAPDAIEKIGPRDKWTLVETPAGGPQQPAAAAGGFFDLERALDESSINVAAPKPRRLTTCSHRSARWSAATPNTGRPNFIMRWGRRFCSGKNMLGHARRFGRQPRVRRSETTRIAASSPAAGSLNAMTRRPPPPKKRCGSRTLTTPPVLIFSTSRHWSANAGVTGNRR